LGIAEIDKANCLVVANMRESANYASQEKKSRCFGVFWVDVVLSNWDKKGIDAHGDDASEEQDLSRWYAF